MNRQSPVCFSAFGLMSSGTGPSIPYDSELVDGWMCSIGKENVLIDRNACDVIADTSFIDDSYI